VLQAGDSLPGDAPEEDVGSAGDSASDERKAAFDVAVVEVAARVGPAYRAADGWLEQTRAGLVELLRFCDERPETARALVVDSIAWGPDVLERRSRLLDTLACALDRSRVPEAGLDTLPSETAVNLVGACVSLVHTRLLQDEQGSLAELAPSLLSMIAQPYLGPEVAKRELEASLGHGASQAATGEPEQAFATVRERSY
jgi:hypothetical protein